MKKIILILISMVALSSLSAFDTVLANIKLTDTKLIQKSYVVEKLDVAQKQVGREFTVEEKDFILDTIINNELLKQAAKRDNVVISEDIVINVLKQQVGDASVSDQQIKDAVVQQYKQPWAEVLQALTDQLTLQEYVKKAGASDLKKLSGSPTKNDIQEFYDSNKTKFVNPDMVRVNHIFFSTQGKPANELTKIKQKAEKTFLDLKQGRISFENAVQTVSDDKNSAKNGGELGFISRDEANTVQLLGIDFINIVFTLSMDQVHGVYKSNAGYHIVEITEKRSARILKLTDPINPASPLTVSQYIKQNLQQQKLTAAFSQVTEIVIAKIRKEAVVKLIDKNIPWK